MSYTVTLTEEERAELKNITAKGNHKSQKVLNCLILLNCDRGEYQDKHSCNEDIANILGISQRKINRVKKRFVEEGIEVAINGHKSSRVYKKMVDGDLEARLIAMSCSEPPEGFSRWSLRLLADKTVELEYTDNISYETVRRVLKKRNKNLEKTRLGNSS